MSDYARDALYDKIIEDKIDRHYARMTYCERDCEQHNESCPYYDPDEEYWDYEECFKNN